MLYEPSKTYEENVAEGPFLDDVTDYRDTAAEPAYAFLGYPIHVPFGIAAGSLPTSRHTGAAFRLGYDVVVYKTQRAVAFPCNPFPNVLPLRLKGDLTLEKMQTPLVAAIDFSKDLQSLSITNSFGVPSPDPQVWTADLPKAIAGAGKGQLLIMSVVGTIQPGFTADDYHEDFARAARLAKDAGAQAVEINLSCPNVASEGVVCYSADAVYDICRRTKAALGDIPLIIKIGYFTHEQQGLLEQIIKSVAPYISAVSAINTLAAAIVDEHGEQALPGEGRLKSGVCGAGIRWAGLDMVERLAALREREGYAYEIIGVGGVMGPEDYTAYRAAGADVVMTVTAAMWNPYLALQIKKNSQL